MYQHITVCRYGKFYVTLVAALVFMGGVATVEAATIAEDADLLDGLVSYWPLDEASGERADVRGTNTLTDSNSVGSVDGINSKAASLVGANRQTLYITDSNQSSLDISQDLSFSLWVQPRALGEGDGQILLSKWRHAVANQYHVYLNDSSLTFILDDDCAGYTYVGRTWQHNMVPGAWYHVVMVYDATSGTAEAFLNQNSIGVVTGLPNSIADCDADFILGMRQNNLDTSYYYDGLIDEVGIWNRALTADEVVKLYNDGEGIPYAAIREEPEPIEYADMSTGELFQRLRAHVHESDMPWWLKKWIDQRLALAEKQIEKGRRGNLRAADVILRSVQWTIERQERRGIISETDADVVRTLIEEIQTRL